MVSGEDNDALAATPASGALSTRYLCGTLLMFGHHSGRDNHLRINTMLRSLSRPALYIEPAVHLLAETLTVHENRPMAWVVLYVNGVTDTLTIFLPYTALALATIDPSVCESWHSMVTGEELAKCGLSDAQNELILQLVLAFRAFSQGHREVTFVNFHDFIKVFTLHVRALAPHKPADEALLVMSYYMLEVMPDVIFPDERALMDALGLVDVDPSTQEVTDHATVNPVSVVPTSLDCALADLASPASVKPLSVDPIIPTSVVPTSVNPSASVNPIVPASVDHALADLASPTSVNPTSVVPASVVPTSLDCALTDLASPASVKPSSVNPVVPTSVVPTSVNPASVDPASSASTDHMPVVPASANRASADLVSTDRESTDPMPVFSSSIGDVLSSPCLDDEAPQWISVSSTPTSPRYSPTSPHYSPISAHYSDIGSDFDIPPPVSTTFPQSRAPPDDTVSEAYLRSSTATATSDRPSSHDLAALAALYNLPAETPASTLGHSYGALMVTATQRLVPPVRWSAMLEEIADVHRSLIIAELLDCARPPSLSPTTHALLIEQLFAGAPASVCGASSSADMGAGEGYTAGDGVQEGMGNVSGGAGVADVGARARSIAGEDACGGSAGAGACAATGSGAGAVPDTHARARKRKGKGTRKGKGKVGT
ncbi:uncharacterized protein BXZ73DRAFT_82555 [Epithele typhae]|uniref:uncharacterized protein n=1 Tax=Epithele typhae TaxID=378194 RepID=UPI002007EB49|nr:uncharacterized protein BXZ73DRAFT_82555 [Epithele typhae]KAH9911954.1 hypothetical protein BXZ73DRAFT_82555 [Epithele typhae]